MSDNNYDGILFIGDPHLSSRVPGFRKDDYPQVILSKFIWVLNHAQANRLLPVVLGDLFHWPRDNANWIVVRLMEVIGQRTVLGVVGNHDSRMLTLENDDTLAILEAAGSIRLVDRSGPWTGFVNEKPVLIGGSTWSSTLPKRINPAQHGADPQAFVVWIAHHNIAFAGYESSAGFAPHDIPGIDLLVNGHIHTPSEGIQTGQTTWLNPGNIARVTRGSVHRARSPHAFWIDLLGTTWNLATIEVPHQSYDDVFYAADAAIGEQEINVSAFVQGLESLRTLRTRSGAGLTEFLSTNLQDDEPEIRNEIMDLAKEVLNDEHV